MAGGVGSRFWPMSTTKFPKQFHDVLGTGKTLIQQTYERLKRIAPKENIFVITNIEYVSLTKEQLPEMSENQIVGEPMMMNTAACNLIMAQKIFNLNEDARLLVAPSDHLIIGETAFVNYAKEAMDASEKENIIITLGIKPSRPDTGYGYIQFEKEKERNELHKVIKFREKPNLKKAKKYLESGDFLWNSGIFIWSAKTILSAFQKDLTEMYNTFKVIKYNTPNESEDMANVYPWVEKISIDYGILEKADNVWVIPSSFGWSDLGTWTSLYENFEKNEEGNAVHGKWIQSYNTSNTIIKTNQEKAIIVDGLHDYIVVDTEKALLVCPRDKDQIIKEYVANLKEFTGEDFM